MLQSTMMQAMSSSEFQRWRRLEQIEPFGEAGEYFRYSVLSALLSGKPARDFLPDSLKSDSEDNEDGAKRIRAAMFLLKEKQDAYLARQAKAASGETVVQVPCP